MSGDVRIVEVGPRDGLQNESALVPTGVKAQFVRDLVSAGLREIEATSFVHPKWVPQLADAQELLGGLSDLSGVSVSALVPNLKGLERAVESGVGRIALFTAASDAFTQKNINMSVAESLDEFSRTAEAFRAAVPGGWIRGYVSTIVECPYSGKVEPGAVAEVVDRLFQIGVDEVSLGETLGVAVPSEVLEVERAVSGVTDRSKVAWHFHDTRGTAIANVGAMLDLGYRSFDSSAAGLGGCPYAKGAGGNLATEDLVYFCHRSGLSTGVDLGLLARASLPVLEQLSRSPFAKTQLAVLSACS